MTASWWAGLPTSHSPSLYPIPATNHRRWEWGHLPPDTLLLGDPEAQPQGRGGAVCWGLAGRHLLLYNREEVSLCPGAPAFLPGVLWCGTWPLSIEAALQGEKQGHHRDSDSGPAIVVLLSHLGTTCLVLKSSREWVFLWLKPLPAGPSVTCRGMYPELIMVSTEGCKTCTAYITRTWNWTGLIYRLMGILYLGSKGILLTESFYTITFWKKRSIFTELMSNYDNKSYYHK